MEKTKLVAVLGTWEEIHSQTFVMEVPADADPEEIKELWLDRVNRHSDDPEMIPLLGTLDNLNDNNPVDAYLGAGEDDIADLAEGDVLRLKLESRATTEPTLQEICRQAKLLGLLVTGKEIVGLEHQMRSLLKNLSQNTGLVGFEVEVPEDCAADFRQAFGHSFVIKVKS